MKTNLTLFDRLMLAVTFAEANEATPALEAGTPGNTNHAGKTRRGNKNNSARPLNSAVPTSAHA